MSNNKQSMKLYTEEHLKIFYHLGKIDGFIGREDDINELIKNYPPIELLSDEEIREERLLQFPDSEYANRANDRLAFYCGAKFVINKIQGGNNEQ